MTGVTRDYTGRQVDLECLQTIGDPVGTTELSLTAANGVSRRVTGMQKAIQRYVTLLLTPSSSVPFPAEDDNLLLDALRAGTVSNIGYLRHLFNMASAVALDIIRRDDYNTQMFGDTVADERIESVELDGITIDYSTLTLRLSLVFRTEAGSDYSYVLPVSTSKGQE
jgi:hypothetical protein